LEIDGGGMSADTGSTDSTVGGGNNRTTDIAGKRKGQYKPQSNHDEHTENTSVAYKNLNFKS